jgi:hypothetical protein
LVRTRTKDFSGRKPVKKPEGKGLDGVAKVKVERKKNGVAKVKAKKKESVGGKVRGGVGRRVEEESDGDWGSGVDEGGSAEEVMWESDGYSGSVDNNRTSGYQTRKRTK